MSFVPNLNIKKALSYGCIAVGYLIAFFYLQYCLQDNFVYQHTLGKVSTNYFRDAKNEIGEDKIPFVEQTNNKTLQWDAYHYKSIATHFYGNKNNGDFTYSPAFFPLFPAVWKVSGLDEIGISILNYFLFAIALAIIAELLIENNFRKYYFYALGLLLPQTVSFIIPYSESVFIFSFALMLFGMQKNKYALFFIGMLMLGATRPAAIFVGFAFGVVEFLRFTKQKNLSLFITQTFKKIIPLIVGYYIAIAIEFLGTGNWNALADAQKMWPSKLGIPTKIYDWSVEGFGLSVFCIFFIVVPLCIYLFKGIIVPSIKGLKKDSNPEELIQDNHYLFQVSVVYLLLISAFTLFYRDGSLNSYQRYMMATGFFYVVLFSFEKLFSALRLINRIGLFVLSSASLWWFLNHIDYGCERSNFKFFGMYLFLFFTALFYFETYLSTKTKLLLLLLLILPALVWNTYLLNAFLSNGWIFT